MSNYWRDLGECRITLRVSLVKMAKTPEQRQREYEQRLRDQGLMKNEKK